VRAHEPALILLDLRMSVMDGWSFVERYRGMAVAPAAIVLMSGDPEVASTAQASAGPVDSPSLVIQVTDRPEGQRAIDKIEP
jgi:CheY-like chemotaxis protein